MDTLAPSLVGSYSPLPGIYDEMMSGPGVFRPHWDDYATSISAMGAEELAQTKKGVGLVNISRGGLIDEPALIDALNSGQVSFAALDVFDNEPTPREEIIKHPKISLTPHIGAATNEAQERIGVELASLIIGHFNK